MFVHGISALEISNQIAALINAYNDLGMKRMGCDILNASTDYVVETHGKYVIAACGMGKVSYQLSELKHMVVRPEWRGKGVGLFVAKRALELCNTPLVYATVRADNVPSLKTLEKAGFAVSGEFPGGNGPLAFLTRVSPKWLRSQQTSKSNSLPETNWTSLAQSLPDMYLGSIPTDESSD